MKVIMANDSCEMVYNRHKEIIKRREFNHVKQLRKCQADVFETEHAYYLMSYKTVIAIISKHTHECFDFLRLVYGYTATSAQHISKFCKDYGATTIYRYK